MAKEKPRYSECMRGKRLQFPFLPTVNVGSAKRPLLFPMELVSVRPGQSFSKYGGDVTAKVVRHAAILPQERFQNLLENASSSNSNSQSVLTALRKNEEAVNFGVTDFDFQPMSVAARLLPPPQLQYRDQVFSPGLAGEWNILHGGPIKFAESPPRPNPDGSYTYGILLVSNSAPRDWDTPTKQFKMALERDASSAGLDLFLGGPPLISTGEYNVIDHFMLS
jgi:hypothetical protein